MRRLFDFAGAWAPAVTSGEFGWAAESGERLLGGVLVERVGDEGFVHGPVVVDPPPRIDPLEIAKQFVPALLAHATSLGLTTLYTRPQGLDRLWVRFGFVPMPEAVLPPAFRGRPESGLHVWRRLGTYAVAAPDERGQGPRRDR